MNMYTTLENVQAEIRAENAFDNNTLPSSQDVERYIEEASKVIDLRTGMTFGSTVVSSEYFDYNNADEIFRFPKKPIISIQSIEYNQNGSGMEPSWITLESGYDKNYLLYNEEGEVQFIYGVNATNKVTPQSGYKRLRISYTHGYTVIPSEIQMLCTLLVAKRVIQTLVTSQGNTEGGEVQVGVIRVSDPSNFSISTLKNMNEEIEKLYSDIGQKYKTFTFTRYYG